MARLQVVQLNGDDVILVIDQASESMVDELGEIEFSSVPGIATAIVTSDDLEYYDPDKESIRLANSVLDQASPNRHQEDFDSGFVAGYAKGAQDRVDPSLSENYDDGYVCFKPTPITVAELNVGGQQPTTIAEAVGFAVAQAGMSAPYGPGTGTFDSTSAKAIVDWALQHIQQLVEDNYVPKTGTEV